MRRMPDRGAPPDELALGAENATNLVVQQVQASERPLKFSSLYGCVGVCARLNELQKGVCVYCETRIAPACLGHIEHFRPKGQVRNEENGKLMRPGYYWLAYSWDNLMLACERCNVGKKGSRFPLRVEGHRVRRPGPLTPEDPILIDPFSEDPRLFIRFNQSVAVSIDANGRGQLVIDILALNDPPLERDRRARLEVVAALRTASLQSTDPVRRANAHLLYQEYTALDAEYSSCLRDNV